MKKNYLSVLLFLVLLAGCTKTNNDPDNPDPVIPTVDSASLILLTTRDYTNGGIPISNRFSAYKNDGNLVWSRNDIGNGYYDPRPYYYKGILFLFTIQYDNTTNENYLYALDAKTGKTIWKITNSTERLVVASFYNDTLYCSSTGTANYICAFVATTGELIWKLPIPETEHFAVGKSDGNMLYFKTVYSSNLNALDLTTKTIKWTIMLDAPPPLSGLKVYGDQLFVITGKSVIAINKKTGQKQWSKSGNNFYRINVANDLVYTTDDGVGLFALQTKTGNVVWQNSNFANGITSVPFIDRENIYVGAVDNTSLYSTSLNNKTGTVNWRKNYHANYSFNIAVGNYIYAFKDYHLNPDISSFYIMKFNAENGVALDSVAVAGNEFNYMSIINTSDSLIQPD